MIVHRTPSEKIEEVKDRRSSISSLSGLGIHKYYIEWKPIEIDSKKKEQFINKLNKCHQQMDLPNYEYKLNKLYKFWQKYVISFDDLYSTDFHVQH